MKAENGTNRTKISRRTWDDLSPLKKSVRERALEGLSMMRQGIAIRTAANRVALDPRTFLRHIRSAVAKTPKGYLAKPYDTISRGLLIKERGVHSEVHVTISNSKTASMIGEYHNAVKKYLNTGDASALRKFEQVYILDSKRKKHFFEIDPNRIE